jgi:hypothetical protein
LVPFLYGTQAALSVQKVPNHALNISALAGFFIFRRDAYLHVLGFFLPAFVRYGENKEICIPKQSSLNV